MNFTQLFLDEDMTKNIQAIKFKKAVLDKEPLEGFKIITTAGQEYFCAGLEVFGPYSIEFSTMILGRSVIDFRHLDGYYRNRTVIGDLTAQNINKYFSVQKLFLNITEIEPLQIEAIQ